MSYIDNNLMSGERVIYRTNLHWIVFLWPIILFVTAIVLFFIGGGVAIAIGVILIILALIIWLFSFIDYKTSEFGITDKRVMVKIGFIQRKSTEILLDKVESIQVDQGILGRMFNFGSITIIGTGGTKDPFHKIANPLEFRKKAQEQIASIQNLK